LIEHISLEHEIISPHVVRCCNHFYAFVPT